MAFKEYKRLNLSQIAKEVLTDWESNHSFKKSIDLRQGAPKFVFYEGPPSANGMPGIHHVMARSIKDIFCRYKTLKGFQVHRKAGWDTHGLPIELSVEKELGITKEDIGKSISVEDYNKACKKAVMRYTDVWNDLTKKMGYWVDMENPYITYKPKYIESVWWLLKNLFEKGLIYKGYTIQPYSPKAGTGLSSHELNQPGTYQDVTDTTVVAQFKAINETLPNFLQNEGELYFLAWTTTPWTLPSNTALTVGPKIEYVLVNTFNQYTFEPTKVVLAKKLVIAFWYISRVFYLHMFTETILSFTITHLFKYVGRKLLIGPKKYEVIREGFLWSLSERVKPIIIYIDQDPIAILKDYDHLTFKNIYDCRETLRTDQRVIEMVVCDPSLVSTNIVQYTASLPRKYRK